MSTKWQRPSSVGVTVTDQIAVGISATSGSVPLYTVPSDSYDVINITVVFQALNFVLPTAGTSLFRVTTGNNSDYMTIQSDGTNLNVSANGTHYTITGTTIGANTHFMSMSCYVGAGISLSADIAGLTGSLNARTIDIFITGTRYVN